MEYVARFHEHEIRPFNAILSGPVSQRADTKQFPQAGAIAVVWYSVCQLYFSRRCLESDSLHQDRASWAKLLNEIPEHKLDPHIYQYNAK